MSIWLSLIPQLQKTGQNSIYPSHNSLLLDGGDGPSWGVVRNSSGSMMANIDNKAKNSLNPPSTTCMTLSDSTQVLVHTSIFTTGCNKSNGLVIEANVKIHMRHVL